MSDHTADSPASAPVPERPTLAGMPASEPDAPEMGALTPVFLVWPRKTFAQTWLFMWIGVCLIIASLLPWHGGHDVMLVNKDGSSITKGQYRQTLLIAEARGEIPVIREFIAIENPGMGIGAIVVLLCGIALVLNGMKNIWTRRLVFWPITLVLFTVLVVLWFTSGVSPVTGVLEMDEASAFSQIPDLVGEIGGAFADTNTDAGRTERADFYRVFDRFGSGLYFSLLTWAFLIVVIAGSLIIAMITSGKKGGAAQGQKGRGARRPGGRR